MTKLDKRTTFRVVLWCGFGAYIAWMIWLLYGQRLGTEIYTQDLAKSMNMKPFATIGRYVDLLSSDQSALVRHAVINLAGTVVMFMPLGYCLPQLFPCLRRFLKTFFLCLLLIVAVESVQYLTRLGTCDVDDLILNLVGISLGYVFSKIKQH